MFEDQGIMEQECGKFREALEMTAVPGNARTGRSELVGQLPAEIRGHLEVCANCEEALNDVVEVQKLLSSLASVSSAAQPGPWFSTKVMSAIVSKENEIETRDGVWVSVMKLAPRLAAVCTLLLVLAGTWAFQTQRAYQARQLMRPAESLFEPSPSVPLNDDVFALAEAHR